MCESKLKLQVVLIVLCVTLEGFQAVEDSALFTVTQAPRYFDILQDHRSQPLSVEVSEEDKDQENIATNRFVDALNVKMHFHSIWNPADKPNYSTNVDLAYSYSEMPHLGNLNYMKIPVSPTDIVKHVDYWGEGRVVSRKGISGFPNSFNINHQYRLVSCGPDRDKKIPNRIPLVSYTDCDTSAFIRNNSVLMVTIRGTDITSSCAKDIARIVNNDHGTVVAYGVNGESQEISELAVELEKKGLSLSKDFPLPSELQGLTYFDSHVAFVNKKVLEEVLYNDVVMGDFGAAVNISKTVVEAVSEIVTKLINFAPRQVLPYAYKLWHAGGQDIVRKHFPKPFQYIINGDEVTIANQLYDMHLKVGGGTKIWGDSFLIRTSVRLSWKFFPTFVGDQLAFTLYNVDHKKFMRMDEKVNKDGDRECWVSAMNGEDFANNRYKFYLEPSIGDDGNVVFIIINVQHNKQGLKLEVAMDGVGDRRVWGHNGNIYDVNTRFRWIVEPWSSGQ